MLRRDLSQDWETKLDARAIYLIPYENIRLNQQTPVIILAHIPNTVHHIASSFPSDYSFLGDQSDQKI